MSTVEQKADSTLRTRGLTVADVLTLINILNAQVYDVTGQIFGLKGLGKFFSALKDVNFFSSVLLLTSEHLKL